MRSRTRVKGAAIASVLAVAAAGVLGGSLQAFSESAADFWLTENARRAPTGAQAQPQPYGQSGFFSGSFYRPLTVPSLTREPRREPRPDAPVRAATTSGAVCVRLCDGSFFPVSSAGGSGSEEEACSSLCPGAPTRVYRLRPSSNGGIEGATSAKNGSTYESLPVAFRYTKTRDETCTCHAPNYSPIRISSFFSDRTLKSGDSVMSAEGIKVFRGAAHFPYRGSDFVALAEAPQLAKGERKTLFAIQRASFLSSAPAEKADDQPGTKERRKRAPRATQRVQAPSPDGAVVASQP